MSTSTPLPAAVSIRSLKPSEDQLPKGEAGEISVTVANPGDATAKDVKVELSGGEGLVLEISTLSLGQVRGQKTKSTRITGTEAGSGTVEASLTSGNAGSDVETTTVQVIGKQGAVEAAKAHIDNALQQIGSTNQDGGPGQGKGGQQSVRAKLSNADAKLDDALSFIDQGRARQVNNMLNAASQMLGALLNQLDGQEATVDNAFYVEQQVEAAIDAIDVARRADI